MEQTIVKTGNVDEVRQLLNFPVEKQPLFVKGGDEAPAQAIVRTDTSDILSVMSPKYKLVPHVEIFDKALERLSQTGYDFNLKETRLINNGARFLQKFDLPDLKEDIGNGDIVNFEVIFKNSYDGSWSFDFQFGFFRLVCSNGLVIGKIMNRIKHKHTPGLNINPVTDSLTKAIDAASKQGVDSYMKMKSYKLSIEMGAEIIKQSVEDEMWPKRYQEEVELNFRNKVMAYTNDNMFDVYNAYTRKITEMSDDTKYSFSRLTDLNKRVFDYLIAKC